MESSGLYSTYSSVILVSIVWKIRAYFQIIDEKVIKHRKNHWLLRDGNTVTRWKQQYFPRTQLLAKCKVSHDSTDHSCARMLGCRTWTQQCKKVTTFIDVVNKRSNWVTSNTCNSSGEISLVKMFINNWKLWLYWRVLVGGGCQDKRL